MSIRGRFDEDLFVQIWQHLIEREHGHGVYRVSAQYIAFTGDDPDTRRDRKCGG